MSDRPMRLKYLTKMKIILCIFLLYITAVSVFGQSVELNSVVGGSVKFPAAVKIEGNLRYSGEVAPIGVVTSGRFTTPRDGRLQWDSSTGLFYLSGLRVEDSGIYTVQDTQQTPVSTFNLTVWVGNVPVSKPHLSVTRNEYRCTVLCAAVRGTGATLTLYREGETNPYVTSPVESAPNLHLPQTVGSGTYTCEAKNSVSRETSDPLTVGAYCTRLSAGTIAAIIIAAVASIIAAVAVFIAVVFALKYGYEHAVLRDVKKHLQNVGLHTNDEEKVEVPPIGIRSLIKVIELLSIGPPHGENSSAFIQYVARKPVQDQVNIEVKPPSPDFIELLSIGPPHGENSSAFIQYVARKPVQDQVNIEVKPPSPDCTKRKMRVEDEQSLFRYVCGIIFGSNAPKTMTSSRPTEFLMNQATPEVGTA